MQFWHIVGHSFIWVVFAGVCSSWSRPRQGKAMKAGTDNECIPHLVLVGIQLIFMYSFLNPCIVMLKLLDGQLTKIIYI